MCWFFVGLVAADRVDNVSVFGCVAVAGVLIVAVVGVVVASVVGFLIKVVVVIAAAVVIADVAVVSILDLVVVAVVAVVGVVAFDVGVVSVVCFGSCRRCCPCVFCRPHSHVLWVYTLTPRKTGNRLVHSSTID